MKYLITSALPYINGIKHLGNVIGSLLPADVAARYLRQQGNEVLYICGTDEHGTPAEIAAEEHGQTVADYCAAMYETQKTIYEQFAIQFDYFGRSSAPENHRLTQEIFLELEKNGFIEEREIRQIYSLADKRFLPDRYVIGTCPHCQYDKARGDQCEGCGRLLDTTDLLNPRSAISGSTDLEVRTSKHLFLKLSLLADEVKTWVDAHPHWSTLTKSTAHKWLTEGLKERCISRDLAWGVKIPKPGFEGKVFYVWFDAPIAYISMTQAWAKQQGDPNLWQQWWRNDLENVNYMQFMAKDNLPFHCIFWPAMMLGTREKWKFADVIKGFNWLTYEGGKFSTSQKRGIFSDVALTLFPADYWRYYLLSIIPESSDSDFSFAGFAQGVNKDLADVLGNFVNRVTALVHKYFAGAVPSYDPHHLDSIELTHHCIQEIVALNADMQALRLRSAIQRLRALWVLGNETMATKQPWALMKTDPAAAGQVLASCLHLIRLYAILSAPFIPTTAGTLFSILGLTVPPGTISWDQAVDFASLPVGQKLNAHGNLFTKITDEEVAALTEQFAG